MGSWVGQGVDSLGECCQVMQDACYAQVLQGLALVQDTSNS